jgi:hypothetical protein
MAVAFAKGQSKGVSALIDEENERDEEGAGGELHGRKFVGWF